VIINILYIFLIPDQFTFEMKKLSIFSFLILLYSHAFSQSYNYDLESGVQGWIPDFADYPNGDSLSYQLNWIHTALPPDLVPTQNGIFMDGLNYSDDLFFFIKKQISGLNPSTNYSVVFSIDVATNENIFMLGGSDLMLKAGATVLEPIKQTDSSGMVRVNINKNNQSSPGYDMDTMGPVRHAFNDTMYHLFTLDNMSHPFSITTGSTGNLWLIVGAESMFESYAKIYFAAVNVTFTSVTGIPPNEFTESAVYPNPVRGKIHLTIPADKIIQANLFNTTGQKLRSASFINEMDIENLPAGIYFVELIQKYSRSMYKVIVAVE
jgi:hypothetical protein